MDRLKINPESGKMVTVEHAGRRYPAKIQIEMGGPETNQITGTASVAP